MNISPEALEAEFSLSTAATRLDFLSRRDSGDTALNTVRDVDADGDQDHWESLKVTDTSLDVDESLELLALGEVISRKAHDSRLVGVRAALRGGATWEQIAVALGVTPQEAWDDFSASIAEGLETGAADAARELAGARPAN
ncbi:MAG TPA: hypothetical protein VGN47_01215 [Blastococcus sp.]|jgi:hypothetical protein|nr:hypothetical protein [Blastococcus sp.]